jgi:hypothetical protein
MASIVYAMGGALGPIFAPIRCLPASQPWHVGALEGLAYQTSRLPAFL